MPEPKRELKDSIFKILFADEELFTQFIHDYVPLEAFQNVTPSDVEDVTERFVSLSSEDQDADTIKRIRFARTRDIYVIALLEHESKVNYRMSFKVLQYMTHIWTAYEAECEAQAEGSTKRAGFMYPAIVPICYYDGMQKWTAKRRFSDRVSGGNALVKYTPQFEYEVMSLRDYTPEQLLAKHNALSLVLVMDQMQKPSDVVHLHEQYQSVLQEITEHTPEHVRTKVAECIAALMRRLNIPQAHISKITDRIKQRGFTDMFAMLRPYDWQETRRASLAEGRAEGRIEGRIEIFHEFYVKGKLARKDVREGLTDLCSSEDIERLLEAWDRERALA